VRQGSKRPLFAVQSRRARTKALSVCWYVQGRACGRVQAGPQTRVQSAERPAGPRRQGSRAWHVQPFHQGRGHRSGAKGWGCCNAGLATPQRGRAAAQAQERPRVFVVPISRCVAELVGHARWEAGPRHSSTSPAAMQASYFAQAPAPRWTAYTARLTSTWSHACNSHPPNCRRAPAIASGPWFKELHVPAEYAAPLGHEPNKRIQPCAAQDATRLQNRSSAAGCLKITTFDGTCQLNKVCHKRCSLSTLFYQARVADSTLQGPSKPLSVGS
jgi:hypothetical protein